MPQLGGIWGVICKSPKELCNVIASSFVFFASRKMFGHVVCVKLSVTFFGRKWTSEATREPCGIHSLFLIKQPCYQPSHSDHDVLIRLTEADWYKLSEQTHIFLVAAFFCFASTCASLSKNTFFVVCVPLQLFLIKHSTQSRENAV